MPETYVIEDSDPPPGRRVVSSSTIAADIRESVAISSFASVAGQPSSLSNLAYSNAIGNVNLSQQNAVSNQQAVNQIGISALGAAVNLVADLQPLEAVAVTKMDTGNDMAEQVSDLNAAVQAFSSGPPGPLPPPPHVLTPRLTKTQKGDNELVVERKDLPVVVRVLDADGNVSVT